MSTTPLTDAIQSLINYANEETGAGDTTLSGVIDTLVNGYGSGGVGAMPCAEFYFTLDEPFYSQIDTTVKTIDLDLSYAPDYPIFVITYMGDGERHESKPNSNLVRCVCYSKVGLSSFGRMYMETTASVSKVSVFIGYSSYGIGLSSFSKDSVTINCRTNTSGDASTSICSGTYNVKVYDYLDLFNIREQLQSDRLECVVDETFEITQTNETTDAIEYGVLDLSAYGSCWDLFSDTRFFYLQVDLIESYDNTREKWIESGAWVGYAADTTRSGAFAGNRLLGNDGQVHSNSQIAIPYYWGQDGLLKFTTRGIGDAYAYAVKGKYRARMFKLKNENSPDEFGSVKTKLYATRKFTLDSSYTSNVLTTVATTDINICDTFKTEGQMYMVEYIPLFECENGFEKQFNIFYWYCEDNTVAGLPQYGLGHTMIINGIPFKSSRGFDLGRNGSTASSVLKVNARLGYSGDPLTEFEAGEYRLNIYKFGV